MYTQNSTPALYTRPVAMHVVHHTTIT